MDKREVLEKQVNEILNDETINRQIRINTVEQQFAVDEASSAIVYKLIGDLCYPDDNWYSSEYYTKAANIWESQGVETVELADVCERAAKSYYGIMGVEEAEEFFMKALSIKEKLWGEGHPDLASLYNDIGIFYQYDPEKSIPYYQKAMDIWIKQYGEDHLYVSYSYYNMGTAYVKCKDYKNAIELLNKALVIRVRENGEDDPDVALVMGHIGGIYYEQGNYEKAIETFSKAYDILKRTVTSKDPCAKQMKKNLDAAKKKLG